MSVSPDCTGSTRRRYFAYGSNMGVEQMRLRCPTHTRLGRATIPDFRWVIAADGYANVQPSAGDEVVGVLYEILPADELALDRFEAVHEGDYTKHAMMVSFGPDQCEALVYVNAAAGTGTPGDEYCARLRQAFADAAPGRDYMERYVHPFLELATS